MTPAEWIAWLTPLLLLLFGFGFLVANIKLGASLLAYRRRMRSALLVWPGDKPKYYGFSLALGVILGLLLMVEAFVLYRSPRSLFGEAMMFLYYGYTFPLSTRIRRGFYGDGIWSDSGFMKWSEISAVSWKEQPTVTLVLISHVQSIARHLEVPGHLYGQARRLLRDRIRTHDIHIGGAGLDLGARDERDTI
ncbi:MAG TPA: hypothetical protein VFS23_06535 [Vicinamibacterales bacterium]|nr:hypothetical protein [Vicinamibacterales bacterium]